MLLVTRVQLNVIPCPAPQATTEVGRLHIVDRALAVGDIVAHADAPTGQVRSSSNMPIQKTCWEVRQRLRGHD